MAADRSAATISDTLREASRRMISWGYKGDAEPDPRLLMVEAADEIERLRAKLAEYDKYVAEFTRHA